MRSSETVFADGGLVFYGRENAEKRGITDFYHRSTNNEIAAKDPFNPDLSKDDNLRKVYLENEHSRRLPPRYVCL